MAPDTVARWLTALPLGARVLDPMCGSGVVVRQSALQGLMATGFDVDPLAVLMSKVWTRKGRHSVLEKEASALVARAKKRKRLSHLALPWVNNCPETRAFMEYWFSEPQRSDLARIAFEIYQMREGHQGWLTDALQIALSRIIVTKHVGASLAWDVSHSRPHRVRDENDFDVTVGFQKAALRLANILDSESLPVRGVVKRGDCRKLTALRDNSFDAVVTSPPYLNAIDYLRGHKFSLVWMGYGIPELRNIRAGAVGTERAGKREESVDALALENAVRSIRSLPERQRSIVHRYARDAALMMREMRRVLKPDGLMALVLGDCVLRGVPVYNSKIFKYVASEQGFVLEEQRKRPLQNNRRYLPIGAATGALANRMKVEVLQSYRLSA
ncbi:MAG: hypothetical protein ABL973_13665 [Micropepsaceae bacterium]